ncbi:MAG: 50S ribosomal protein L9 [Pseudomonadota bacterium]|nr:50S ribosomal protein L9 [Pseudomonadota bacterium]
MEVILLERVENLGQMGDVVKVRDGFARNFLLPRKKALRANDANRQLFAAQRADLEARNLERRKEAEAAAAKIDGLAFVVIRQASETGLLYGSVSTRDIAETAAAEGVSFDRTQVRLDKPLKALGVFPVRIMLHPEVSVTISINVARSLEEAERQARGEIVLARGGEEAGDAEADVAEFFDEGAAPADEAEEETPAE